MRYLHRACLLCLLLVSGAAPAPTGEKPQLGVTLKPTAEEGEVIVAEVGPGTTADEMGLLPGDQIVSLNGQPIDSVEGLIQQIQAHRVGDAVRLEVLREGQRLTLEGSFLTAARRTAVGRPAPPWQVQKWANLGPGEQPPTLESLQGKVIVLFCFQSWCPGCHSRGFPVHQALEQAYAKDERVEFLYFQTVFEGFTRNSFEAGLADLEKLGIDRPYGFDPGAPDTKRWPSLMSGYLTGGTPWTVIIDAEGVVRLSEFTPAEVSRLRRVIDGSLPQDH